MCLKLNRYFFVFPLQRQKSRYAELDFEVNIVWTQVFVCDDTLNRPQRVLIFEIQCEFSSSSLENNAHKETPPEHVPGP